MKAGSSLATKTGDTSLERSNKNTKKKKSQNTVTCNNRFSVLDSDKLLSDTTVNEVAQKNYVDQILNVAQYSNYGKVFIKSRKTESKEALGTNPKNKEKSNKKGCNASEAQFTKIVEEGLAKKEPKEEIRVSQT